MDLYRLKSERLCNKPGRKGKISVEFNLDPSQKSGDNGNKWRMTSLFMFCRPRSFGLFGCKRPLSNQPSGMFSLVCDSGMADFCFRLSSFSSMSLKLDNNIHFPADFLLCFTPYCCYYFFHFLFFPPQSRFFYLFTIAVHSNKNIYIKQMFSR